MKAVGSLWYWCVFTGWFCITSQRTVRNFLVVFIAWFWLAVVVYWFYSSRAEVWDHNFLLQRPCNNIDNTITVVLLLLLRHCYFVGCLSTNSIHQSAQYGCTSPVFFIIIRINCYLFALIMSQKCPVHAEGQDISSIVVGRHYDVNRMMVYVIKENKDLIKINVKSSGPSSAEISCENCRDPFLEKTDKGSCARLEVEDGRYQGTMLRTCKARQINTVIHFFSKSYAFPSAMHSVNHPDNSCLKTSMPFQ